MYGLALRAIVVWVLIAELVSVSTVPIPGAVWLLGSGFIGLVGLRRKLRK